jgi:chemotaxis family two-component system response regulator Rcp1
MHRMPYAGTIPDVLVVDDNPSDLQLLGEAFAECGVPAHLQHASTGEQAWDRLERRGGREGLSDPDLMILDLNMPRLDGRALLQRLAENPRWRHLPVVVLTSSSRSDDVAYCSRMGAISYYVKPHSWDEYLTMVRSFKEFWVARP